MRRLSLPASLILFAWIVSAALGAARGVYNSVAAFHGGGPFDGSEAPTLTVVAGRVASGLVFLIPALGAMEESFRAEVLAPLIARVLLLASGDWLR